MFTQGSESFPFKANPPGSSVRFSMKIPRISGRYKMQTAEWVQNADSVQNAD